MKIPYNKPHLTGKETKFIKHAHSLGRLAGDGYYTKKCQELIEKKFHIKKTLLTHSCTAALEMSTILGNIRPGDEVIMPSFTFASTANAVVLRGGIPVFIDIRPDTKNIDEKRIESAITKKTKAVFIVHYAGVGAEMDSILEIAKKHKLLVFEDAAQGFMAYYKGKALGTFGDLGAYSFHETKNVISGEGGALIVNNNSLIKRSEIIREKGTNRTQFFRGEVDKYTWVDIGSSYLPGEIIAAFLFAQMEDMEKITKKRIRIWNKYHFFLKELEKKEKIERPFVPSHVTHNGHLYYLLARNCDEREKLIQFLKKKGILSISHYVPLHSSPAGKKFGKSLKNMSNTDNISDRLLRLPLYYGLSNLDIEMIVSNTYDFYKKH